MLSNHPKNLNINNLSDIDKEKMKEDINKEKYKEQLVGEQFEKEKNYIQVYNKFWPFRVLKITNLILLFILAVGSWICISYTIDWSKYWTTVLYEEPYHMEGGYAFSRIILFIFAFCSLIAHHFVKYNTFLAGVFSLMDICFYALTIPILIIASIIFSIKCLAEYRWFGPKLANFNYTFEGYADLTEIESYYLNSYSNDYLLDRIADRKKQLFVNLLLDPICLVLASFAILVNLLLIFNLYKKMRKSQFWAAGLNNYKTKFPNCSLIEKIYSHHYPFGMLKTSQWLLQTLLLFSAMYFPYFASNRASIYLILPAIVSFIHWLLYYCTVHLESQNNAKPIRLSTLFFADIIISYSFTILFFAQFISSGRYGAYLFLFGLILYGGYSLILTFVYLRNNGDGSFKFPISIKINVEIIQKSDKELKEEKDKNKEEIKKAEENNLEKQEN
ncbi:unnamed protein product [Meloidogyne enterolobii]|uniref:Uncharacterized protein n=1 Tax=Meloidogyne enterolobii TaxID=390850 RepID=A0ACB1AFY6_MELEN